MSGIRRGGAAHALGEERGRANGPDPWSVIIHLVGCESDSTRTAPPGSAQPRLAGRRSHAPTGAALVGPRAVQLSRPGGTAVCQSVARWYASPIRNAVASSKPRQAIWSERGSPLPVRPFGTTRAQ